LKLFEKCTLWLSLMGVMVSARKVQAYPEPIEAPGELQASGDLGLDPHKQSYREEMLVNSRADLRTRWRQDGGSVDA
jgi:hypothetical protein